MSSLTIQQQERRFREGLRWVDDKPPREPLLPKVAIALFLALCLQSLLFYIFNNNHEALKTLLKWTVVERTAVGISRDNYAGMLAQCLNGNPLVDNVSGAFLLTERAIEYKHVPMKTK